MTHTQHNTYLLREDPRSGLADRVILGRELKFFLCFSFRSRLARGDRFFVAIPEYFSVSSETHP